MMRRNLALVAISIAALAAVSADPAKPGPAAEFDRLFEECKKQGQRVNGARLQVKLKEQTAERLVLDWSLDYDGPRKPLILIRPTTGEGEHLLLRPSQAGFRFTSEKPDKRLHQETHVNCLSGPWGEGGRERDFLHVEGGKLATGVVRFPDSLPAIDPLHGGFPDPRLRGYPQALRKPQALRVFVQFYFKPTDRGVGYGLDAWTGELWSEPLLLNLDAK